MTRPLNEESGTGERAIPEEPSASTADRLPGSTVASPLSGESQGEPSSISGASKFSVPGAGPSENYEIRGEIGRGALGRVLEAHDRRLHRTVALKELLQQDGGAEVRFVREALITARLQHPAIVPVYEAGQWPSGAPFYAMKKVSGKSLDAVISGCSNLSERMSLLSNVVAVAEAISYAHVEGVIHRDLKPANVLVGSFGETVVVDWGLAKQLSTDEVARNGGADYVAAATSGLTVVGSVIGTPAYMSSEQANGSEADARSDVYALGAILYHLVTGQMPFAGSSGLQVLEHLRSNIAPRAVEDLEPRIAPDLAAVIKKAMHPIPEHRYPTATEFAADLKRFQTGQLVRAHSYSFSLLLQRWVKRHRAAVLVGATLVSALALTAAFSVRRIIRERNEADRQRIAAQQAQQRADNRANELILLHARTLKETDPTATIAWLKNYPTDPTGSGAVRVIAADALERGLAFRVLRGHNSTITHLSFFSDGNRLATGSFDTTVRLWDLSSAATRLFDEHRDIVVHAAISPNEKWVASASWDGSVGLWNLTTDQRRRLLGHQDRVLNVAFSPDSRWLASASSDRTVRLWDVESGQGRVLATHEKWVGYVGFSPDGKRLFSAGGDHTVREWDVSGTQNQVIGRHEKPVNIVALAPDGQTIASGDMAGEVKVWDLTGSKRSQTLQGLHGAAVVLAWSHDGRQIAAAGQDESIPIWQRTGELVQTLRGHQGPINAISFAHHSQMLASGGSDRTLRLWDIAQGSQRTLRGHSAPVERVEFSPDDRWVATASFDNTIRLWSTQALSGPIFKARGPLRHVAFSPDGRTLVAGGADALVYSFSRESGQAMTLGKHEAGINFVAFSPTEPLVATASDDRTIRLFALSGLQERVLAGHNTAVQVLRFSPDGKALFSGGSDGTVRKWDLSNGTSRVFGEHRGTVYQLAISPDGLWIASGGEDRAVRLWNTNTGEVRILNGEVRRVRHLEFSADGRFLAAAADAIRVWDTRAETSRLLEGHGGAITDVRFLSADQLVSASKDKTLRVWSLASGQSTVLRGHEDLVTAVAVSPDRKTVASASWDHTLRLWDLASGETRVLNGHRGRVQWVAFSPDGQSIASASDDSTVFLWSDHLPTEAKELHQWLEAATNMSMSSQR